MSWIIGILLVGAGAVIGFFVARYWFHEHSEQALLTDQVAQTKQQLADYQREVAEHFATATALVEQLEETQDKLKSYLNNSADILQRQQMQPTLPFFAEDTMRQLRMANTVNRDRKDAKKEHADSAPRDYSEQKSGLFSSTKE